jgi:tRNA nucleotidyltransferase (CCA-adding enzyme)
VPPSLDFVTARTEFYERPTALPQVERSSIKQDLYRRDFTINTMAICLDRERYGELLDYYGGERDLEQGLIRVLHNLSFVEDPHAHPARGALRAAAGVQIEERTRS